MGEVPLQVDAKLSHSLTLSLPPSLTLTHSLTLSRSMSHSLSLTLSLTHYRGTSLIRKLKPLGPYRRPVPRVIGGS